MEKKSSVLIVILAFIVTCFIVNSVHAQDEIALSNMSPVILLFSCFLAALFFCFFGNFMVPKYLKHKLFSKRWWLYVLMMTGIFMLVYMLHYLFGTKEEVVSRELQGKLGIWKSLSTVCFVLLALTFYLKDKKIKMVLYWLSALSILFAQIYYLYFFKTITYQVILGFITGIYVLAYGPTGQLDKLIEKIKEKKK